MDYLEDRFYALWEKLDAKVDNSKVTYSMLSDAYSASDRYYFDMDYIYFCLNEFDEVDHKLRVPDAVELAIWFHKLIYSPRLKDSEVNCAWRANFLCSSSDIPEEFGDYVSELIMSLGETSIIKYTDCRYLIDITNFMFGQSEEGYRWYEYQVRRERPLIQNKTYDRIRKRYLESLLERRSIYMTDFFQERHEKQAKTNIERRILDLSKQW